MTRQNKYRALLLGCGPRAGAHVRVYPDIPTIDLVAVCERDTERRERFMSQCGIEAGFEDYEAALRQIRPSDLWFWW